MPFRKGQKPPANAGRKKGIPNKVTASMREAWREAFDELGGIPSLVAWGRENPTDFYKLVTKLIPQDVTSGGEKLQNGVVILPPSK